MAGGIGTPTRPQHLSAPGSSGRKPRKSQQLKPAGLGHPQRELWKRTREETEDKGIVEEDATEPSKNSGRLVTE